MEKERTDTRGGEVWRVAEEGRSIKDSGVRLLQGGRSVVLYVERLRFWSLRGGKQILWARWRMVDKYIDERGTYLRGFLCLVQI